MTVFAAKDAKNRFGEMIDTARRAPVDIEKNGRRVAVVMSAEEYDRLTALEDAWWAARADAAKAGGFVDVEESEAYLRQLLNAPD